MLPKELLGLDRGALQELMAAWGEGLYRADQLYQGLYCERLRDPARISTLPKRLRARLASEARITWPHLEKQFLSVDGTRRYLLRLADGETIEAVLMPGPSSAPTRFFSGDDRDTVCISTQAGCAVGCEFCLTAQLGLKRNLTAGEIVGQVLLAVEESRLDTGGHAQRPVNLVFMGMGEPLLNYDETLRAVRLLADPRGINLSPRRMTLSTSGILPRIAQLGREPVRPRLAVSLNATTDEVRTRLMPLNKKWNLAALLEACRDFPLRPGERLTFEYVLLDGVNDTAADARRLVRLLNGLRAKVNLIALNPGPELPFRTPPDQRVLAFQEILAAAGLPAFIRKPRGRDIFAACGQLRGTVEPERELATEKAGPA